MPHRSSNRKGGLVPAGRETCVTDALGDDVRKEVRRNFGEKKSRLERESAEGDQKGKVKAVERNPNRVPVPKTR